MFKIRPYILIVGLALIPTTADAIYPSDGGWLDGPCSWASVVKVGDCTGTLIGPGTVLTAAHCDLEGSETIYFGEDLRTNLWEDTADLTSCTTHHLYVGEKDGVDLAICRVDPMTPAPEVPIIPIMVPTGPARDWLSNQVYGPSGPAEVALVGVGHSALTTTGIKYQGPSWLYDQWKHVLAWSPTVLRSHESAPEEDDHVVVRNGDSGGPMFVEMPDGSWMQIGVASVSGELTNKHEAAPSWLAWIYGNDSAGDDSYYLPCHDYVDGEWVWVGDCAGTYPLNPGESYEEDWSEDCAGVDYGGGVYPNGGSPGNDSPGPGGLLRWRMGKHAGIR